MWISGVVWDRFASYTGVRDVLDAEVSESYGVDPCSTCVLDDDTVEVTVSEVNSPLNAEEMEGLRENVNPLTISSEYGVDLFLRAACYVAERIGQRWLCTTLYLDGIAKQSPAFCFYFFPVSWDVDYSL